jgi:Family of unknown function (DUF5317)
MNKIVVPIILLLFSLALLLTGSSLNQTVMNANGGKMPVAMDRSTIVVFDSRHEPLTPQTRYKWLADIFWFPGYLFSLGDIFIYSSVVIFWAAWVLTFLNFCAILYKSRK